MQRDILGRNAEKDQGIRTRNLATATPLKRTSVTDGHTEFNGNESLLVKGSQKVSGWLIVTGTLKVVGAFLLEGITTISGALSITGPNTSITGPFHVSGNTDISGNVEITGPSTTITGPFHVEGNTDIQGNLEIHGPSTRVIGPFHVEGDQDNTGALWIRGVTSLSNDLRVLSGGKITAGGLTVTPTGELSSASNIVVTTPSLSMSDGIRVAGKITNPGITTATATANVWVNTLGVLYETSSAARFKIDAAPMDLPDSLLGVPLKWWIDLGNAERFAALYDSPHPFTEQDQIDYDGADLTRIPGVIAEEVLAAGGEAFVTYDKDGAVQGVAYDRFALARTEVLSRQLADLRAEVAELRRSLG